MDNCIKMNKTYYYNVSNVRYAIDVTPETVDITPYAFQKNDQLWEQDSLNQFYSRINPSARCTVVDIGAQSGLYSLYARHLPLSTFYSFEPFQPTFQLLKENLELNDIKNVNPINIALSNQIGKAIMNTCIGHNGLNTMGMNVKRFADILPIEVNTTTLDEMFYKKNIPVDFIKLDTGGFEYYILQGGMNTIYKNKPVIQMEWNTTNMEQANVTEDILYNFFHMVNYKEVSHVHEEKLFMAV
jgi:FkbM family methyltransferase